MLLMLEVLKVVFSAVYRVMLVMLEVSKVNSFIYYVHSSEQNIKGYVEGVKRDSKYTIRAHDIFAYNFLNIQPIFNLKKVLKS